MIGRSGERGSGISMLAARHDNDDDDDDDWLRVLPLQCKCESFGAFVCDFLKINKKGLWSFPTSK